MCTVWSPRAFWSCLSHSICVYVYVLSLHASTPRAIVCAALDSIFVWGNDFESGKCVECVFVCVSVWERMNIRKKHRNLLVARPVLLTSREILTAREMLQITSCWLAGWLCCVYIHCTQRFRPAERNCVYRLYCFTSHGYMDIGSYTNGE